MKKPAVFVAMAVVTVMVATGVLIWSGSGTTQAAKPIVTVGHLEIHDSGSCNLTSHLTWYGTKFAHQNGKVRFVIFKTGTAIATPFIDIAKGTVPTLVSQRDESWLHGPLSSGSWQTRAFFRQTIGKDGERTGRLFFESTLSATFVCP